MMYTNAKVPFDHKYMTSQLTAIVLHTCTHVHIHTQTDKSIAIGEFLQIFLKIQQ